MTRRVLDVGQCNPDHAAIRRLLEQNFSVIVERAHHLDDALKALRNHTYDLVLINRKLDIDYSDGMEILLALKQDARFSAIPVMLVTNYPEFQQLAVEAGAMDGFGKDELRSSDTLDKLRSVLAEQKADAPR